MAVRGVITISEDMLFDMEIGPWTSSSLHYQEDHGSIPGSD